MTDSPAPENAAPTEPRDRGDLREGAPEPEEKRPLWRQKTVIAAAIGLAVALVLTVIGVLGRQGDDGQSGSGQSGPVAAIQQIDVAGRPGATPTLTVKGELHTSGIKARTISDGAGREIVQGSPVLLAVTAFDSKGVLQSKTGYPDIHSAHATAEELGTSLAGIVIGKKEGSRLVFLRNISGSTDDSSVEVDVVDILPTLASGSEVEPAEAGPLSVSMGEGGPVIKHGDDAAPSNLVTQVIMRGDGQQVAATDRIIAQYTAVRWDDGVVQANSWDTGMPQVIDMNTTMPGIKRALADRTVGSRVAVTIPSDQATGDGVLCVVVDILAIDHQGSGDVDGDGSGGETGDAQSGQ